ACMTDADDDDYGDDMPTNPDVTPGTDCDDNSPYTFKGAAPLDDPEACMKDEDDDDYGDTLVPDGVTPGTDCVDTNGSINPGDSVLMTIPDVTGEVSSVDPLTGALTPFAQIDVMGVPGWFIESFAYDPIERIGYASLGGDNRLVTFDYCNGGPPTLLMPIDLSICGITFDRDGNLYGIDNEIDVLVQLDKDDGSILNMVPVTVDGAPLNVGGCGMTLDCGSENGLLFSDSNNDAIYRITPDGVATPIASLPGETFGRGLAYDPTTKEAYSCSGITLLQVALDNSNNFMQLPDLSGVVNDLEFGPSCN
ncbi:MAG: hypothetical protein KC636_05575, partial [Myxococcales bacterium]|nr:hypothetical protein [Myxococcales bacterium]